MTMNTMKSPEVLNRQLDNRQQNSQTRVAQTRIKYASSWKGAGQLNADVCTQSQQTLTQLECADSAREILIHQAYSPHVPSTGLQEKMLTWRIPYIKYDQSFCTPQDIDISEQHHSAEK